MRVLEKKYREEEEDELGPPPGMEFLNLSVFSREKYEAILKDHIEVPVIGKTELEEEEKEILRKH